MELGLSGVADDLRFDLAVPYEGRDECFELSSLPGGGRPLLVICDEADSDVFLQIWSLGWLTG